jgi:hypothetical protein
MVHPVHQSKNLAAVEQLHPMAKTHLHMCKHEVTGSIESFRCCGADLPINIPGEFI